MRLETATERFLLMAQQSCVPEIPKLCQSMFSISDLIHLLLFIKAKLKLNY